MTKYTDVDVVIDVSHADVTNALCSACMKAQIPVVIGTTGHSAEQRGAIEKTARSVAVVLASNFSIGVNALFALTRRSAEILGERIRSENHRDASSHEERCAERHGENDCRNSP